MQAGELTRSCSLPPTSDFAVCHPSRPLQAQSLQQLPRPSPSVAAPPRSVPHGPSSDPSLKRVPRTSGLPHAVSYSDCKQRRGAATTSHGI